MKKSPLRVLLVGVFNESSKDLIPILEKNDYVVDTTEVLELAVQRITNEETNLVISSKQLNGYNGFEVYNQLKPYLLDAGIPFFMVPDKFDKDDVLIGLEMGIDNFIFPPLIESVVVHAIENELKKKSEINFHKTHAFKHYFFTTSVAMFFKSNGKISLVNEAFCRLTGTCGNKLLDTAIEELFFLEESETNKMNYRRFKSGVSDECLLKNIKWYKNHEANFDITFYRSKTNGPNDVFAEVVTSFCPSNNTGTEILQGEFSSVYSYQKAEKEIEDCEVRLTNREKQVYILSAEGMALKQIAAELNLSQRTVEKHRANIMQKTKTTNFIETMVKIGHKFSNLQT